MIDTNMTDNSRNLFHGLLDNDWSGVYALGTSNLSTWVSAVAFVTVDAVYCMRVEVHIVKPPQVTTRPGDDVFSLWIEQFEPDYWQNRRGDHDVKCLSDEWRGSPIWGLLEAPRRAHFFTEKEFDYPIIHSKPSLLMRCAAMMFTSPHCNDAKLLLTTELTNVAISTGGETEIELAKHDWLFEYTPAAS